MPETNPPRSTATLRIWLDDEREGPMTWHWILTPGELQAWLRRDPFGEHIAEMSLDHDLGPDQMTGYELLRWMAETDHWPDCPIHVHSMNPVGAKRMRDFIEHMRLSREEPEHTDG